DHEHDISNAPLATPVYTVSNFNSLLVFDAHHTANRAIDHTRRRSACARVISRAAAASTGKPAIWEASA
ncbi:hypothetical protein QOU69_23340, partial [Burkholderia pseudomallei]|nr:hypothetical protein [Burkholderia pseudomallei]